MTLEELLKAKNLTDEQVTAIIGGMKENKIFTASEENLDIRYGKLKTNHDALVAKDAESQKLIEELQKATKGQDAVQAKITEYHYTAAGRTTAGKNGSCIKGGTAFRRSKGN